MSYLKSPINKLNEFRIGDEEDFDVDLSGMGVNDTPPATPPTTPPATPPTTPPAKVEPSTGKITIDEVEYSLDRDGNALDENGNVFKKKEELTITPQNFEGTVAYIQHLTGIVPVDEKGTPIQYPETEEGIADYTRDVIAIQNAQFEEQYQKDFLTQIHPAVKRLHMALATGEVKDELEYFEKIAKNNITNVKIDENTPDEVLLDVIAKRFELRGFSTEEAKDLAQRAKDKGTHRDDAKKAYDDITKLNAEQDAAREKQIKESIAQEEERIKQHWAAVEDIVLSKGKLNNILIPVNERGNFYKYVSEPIDERGYTQEMIDREKESLDIKLLNAYQRYKKYNMQDMILAKDATSQAKTIREKLKNSTKKINSVFSQNANIELDEQTMDELTN